MALQARRPWQWLLTLLILAVSYLALTPNPPHALDTGWDKLNHALAFVALAVSACLGFASSWRPWLLVPLALVAFGGGIEIAQSFVPGRTADWADLLADAVGVTGGVLLALALSHAARALSAFEAKPS